MASYEWTQIGIDGLRSLGQWEAYDCPRSGDAISATSFEALRQHGELELAVEKGWISSSLRSVLDSASSCNGVSPLAAQPRSNPPNSKSGIIVWSRYLEDMISETYSAVDELPAQPCQISPGVYLGGLTEARDVAMLQALGIDRIVNMASGDCGLSVVRNYPGEFETLDINAKDGGSYDIFSFDVPRALAFIEKARVDDRNVLVHCYAGMNRSATVCAVWMLRQRYGTICDIVRHLVRSRGIVLQNSSFLKGLVDLSRDYDLLKDDS